MQVLLKHRTDPEPRAVTGMFCGFLHQVQISDFLDQEEQY